VWVITRDTFHPVEFYKIIKSQLSAGYRLEESGGEKVFSGIKN